MNFYAKCKEKPVSAYDCLIQRKENKNSYNDSLRFWIWDKVYES